MSANIVAARRALERDLRTAEANVERLKKAVRALVALDNPRSTGKRLPNKGIRLNCKTRGCGRPFTAKRKDAKFCPECQVKRHRGDVTASAQKKGFKLPTRKTRGTTLVRNTPTATKK